MIRNQGPGVTSGLCFFEDAGEPFQERLAVLVVDEDLSSFNSPGHYMLQEAWDVKSGLAGHGFYSLTEFTGITEKYMIVQRP